MIGRLTCAGLIILMAVLSGVAAVRAEDTTSVPTVTPSEIVITDDVQPYTGPLGPDSPLYGLKLALENLDEAFTFNTSEKVVKEMQHAELRIAEIKGLLLMNKSVVAERALDGYFEKMNLTSLDLSSIPARTTGIANAYQQHVKHELVLYDLLQANPNSTELRQAYNRTLDLEGQFMEKSTIMLEKRIGQLNRITAKVVRINERAQEKGEVQGSAPAATTAPITSETTDHGKGKEKQVGKDTGAAPVTTGTTAATSPEDNSGNDKGNGKGKGPK
jgi:Domain of unknown function (DUF5667)